MKKADKYIGKIIIGLAAICLSGAFMALPAKAAPDIPQGFDPTMEAEGCGGVGYAIEPDHWLRLQAHPEWQETREEVNVERENNFWVITAPQETADDLLELIIGTADTKMEDVIPVTYTTPESSAVMSSPPSLSPPPKYVPWRDQV